MDVVVSLSRKAQDRQHRKPAPGCYNMADRVADLPDRMQTRSSLLYW